jgi:rod shape determining protein RodA
MFDRRLVQNFNWGLLGLTTVLLALGIMTLYSAVTAGPDVAQKTLIMKQLIWYGTGFLFMIILVLFDYKSLEQWSYFIYAVCVCLLLYVLFFGKYAGGSRRWIYFGFFSIQPSELIKIAVIISLSHYYTKRISISGLTLRDLIQPMILIAVPFILILKQPDLGTALLIVLIAASITFFAKIEKRSLLYLMVSGFIFIPMVWFFLKDYQKQRILVFLNPDRDPLGAGYHIIQSKIAIGSGMIHGKGFLKGTQNALSFLPEQHTDFIFSVMAEEWGFLGSSTLLILLILLIVLGLSIAHSCRDPFGILLSVGLTSLIFWEVFINIGMVMGLMPVVGVPLPFISYGGSSVITKMICVGLLLNISMRRFMIQN